jgi:hypothetical protein
MDRITLPGCDPPEGHIGAACAGLVAFALVRAWVPNRLAKFALSAALLYLSVKGAHTTYDAIASKPDYYQWPKHFRHLLKASPHERQVTRVVDWLWPVEWARARETEIGRAGVIVYDESGDFISEFFTRDYHTKVGFVSSTSAKDYVQRVRDRKARWAGVTRGSAAEAELRAAGAEFLFHAPRTVTALYRMPR